LALAVKFCELSSSCKTINKNECKSQANASSAQ